LYDKKDNSVQFDKTEVKQAHVTYISKSQDVSTD